jgi:ketosteroid isomerase-like protein
MSAPGPLAQQFAGAVAGFSVGDLDPLMALFREDAVWHAAGTSRLAGRYEGHEAIRGWFAAMYDLGFVAEPLDMLEDETHFVFLLRIAGQGIEQTHANAWRVEGGKFTEGFFLPDDQDAWDAVHAG